MVNTKNRLKSVVPQVFNFDPFPYVEINKTKTLLIKYCWKYGVDIHVFLILVRKNMEGIQLNNEIP